MNTPKESYPHASWLSEQLSGTGSSSASKGAQTLTPALHPSAPVLRFTGPLWASAVTCEAGMVTDPTVGHTKTQCATSAAMKTASARCRCSGMPRDMPRDSAVGATEGESGRGAGHPGDNFLGNRARPSTSPSLAMRLRTGAVL